MVKNSAFVFVKPHAVTDKVKDLVESVLKEKGLKIVKKGSLKSEVIDKKKLIDNHYYAIASKATMLKPSQLNVPVEKFKKQFGLEWQAALDAGEVFNAMDACAFLGVDADALSKLWEPLRAAGKFVKFGGGFSCGCIEHEGKKAYVINGFYMSMRSAYVKPGHSIFYYVVEWSADKLTWADFRDQVCGPTDPKDAPAGSLRGQIYADWEKLDLTSQPNTGDNAIHASASPFEALTERMNWLNFFADRDTFGAALTSAGVPPRTIKEWAKDPQVDIGAGEMGSLYDALECLDSDACIAKACDLWNINRPKPVGKVSGVQYDFGNQYAKIVAGTNPCHKVLETDGVLAFLADPPVCEGHTIVATKTVGFATFLDLPAGKAAELSAAQNRVSRVIMDAVGASGINVWLDSGAEAGQTVFHPHLHVVPRKAGDNLYKAPPSGAQLSDDAAKELISKIDAALHPPPPLMQPKFMRIAKIDPDSAGLNLKVKVVGDVTEVEEKKGKVFEVQVGDDSGVVTMSVSEAQKTIFTKGKVLELRNASIKMVKGHIRLLVDKWGKVSDCSDTVEVSDKKDVSATEYELVKA